MSPRQKVEEEHSLETSELQGEVEAQIRAAAEAQEAMEAAHNAALGALKAEHAKEKVRYTPWPVPPLRGGAGMACASHCCPTLLSPPPCFFAFFQADLEKKLRKMQAAIEKAGLSASESPSAAQRRPQALLSVTNAAVSSDATVTLKPLATGPDEAQLLQDMGDETNVGRPRVRRPCRQAS